MAKAELSPFTENYYMLGYLGNGKFVAMVPQQPTVNRTSVKRDVEVATPTRRVKREKIGEGGVIDLTL